MKTVERGAGMKTMMIRLSSVDDVRAFVNDVSKLNGDFELVSGRYVVDAKSIMGIFSLDLTEPLELKMFHTHEDMTALNKYAA